MKTRHRHRKNLKTKTKTKQKTKKYGRYEVQPKWYLTRTPDATSTGYIDVSAAVTACVAHFQSMFNPYGPVDLIEVLPPEDPWYQTESYAKFRCVKMLRTWTYYVSGNPPPQTVYGGIYLVATCDNGTLATRDSVTGLYYCRSDTRL